MYIFQPDRYLLEAQIKKVAGYIKGRTLDVGAGTVNRYGADFNTTEYLRLDTSAGPDIDIVGSIYHIPLEENSIDSIVCTQVFEHLAHPTEGMQELYRVLRPGGHAVITVPQMNELHEEPHDYFRYTNFGIETLCVDAGFTVVSMDQRGGYYALVAQLHIRHWIDRYVLYEKPILGRIMGKLILLYGSIMLVRDSRSNKAPDLKHAIGWCVVVRK